MRITRHLSAWPLPALLTWAAAWAVVATSTRSGATPTVAVCLGVAVGMLGALRASSATRAAIVGLGFPLSLAASGVLAVPAWVWLGLLASFALVYPVKLWGDAPVFPTPRGALAGLERSVPLPAGARILDAGCGSGSALAALHAAYPDARLDGVEWSWPLRLVAALRCPWARVRRRDMWAVDWSVYSMIYIFQRPETMARLMDKAAAELAPGAVLASLEFPVKGVAPWRVHTCPDGRKVWIYRHAGC